MILLHDGPITSLDSQTRVSAVQTRRVVEKYIKAGFNIQYIETPQRYNDWGHSLRALGLEKATGEYLQITNADNLVVPTFVEDMLNTVHNGNMDVGICDVLHSYPITGEPFNVLFSTFQISNIDMCNFITRTVMAKQLGFKHRTFAADGLFVEDWKAMFPGFTQRKINRVLAIHC